MLINCVVYENGRRIGEVPTSEISEHVGKPGRFVWVALKDPDTAELATMQEEFDLHDLAIEDVVNGNQRPKLEEYGDTLFLVLHTVEEARDDLNEGEVDVFVGPSFVLSVRSRSERGFRDVRQRAESEPELLQLGPAYVLYALLDAVVDRYSPILDRLEEDLEAIEREIFAGRNGRANVEALYDLKQRIMTLRHAATPLMDAVGKLYGGRVPRLCVGLQDYFRDVYDHLVRLDQSIDALREMVTTAINVNLSLITLAENEVTKRLAAYAALVAVPTLIAGVYGMNFEHMPELKWAFGYPFAVGLMVALDTYLFFRFRRAGWL